MEFPLPDEEIDADGYFKNGLLMNKKLSTMMVKKGPIIDMDTSSGRRRTQK